MSDPVLTSHHDLLARGLSSLGFDARPLRGFVVLAGGSSGARTYRLRFPAGDLVLKVTVAAPIGRLPERGRREILFYRYLAADARIPVPRLIASHLDQTLACLLLESCVPAPDPSRWIETMFVRVAEQLARLHAAFWNRADELAAFGWLRPDAAPGEADIRAAASSWARLRAEPRFAAVLTAERYADVLEQLGRLARTGIEPDSFPVTLCHGDFHAGNILVGPRGETVVADWQEVGPGRGPEDLSFFIQRAAFSGATVPVDAMVAAYRRGLTAAIGRVGPERDIRRVADAAELRTRLLHWPAFLTAAPAHQLAELLDRIQTLTTSRET